MNNAYTKLRKVCLWVIAIALIGAGACIGLSFVIKEMYVPLIGAGLLVVGLIFFIIMLVNNAKMNKAISAEEDDLIRDIHLLGYGEKKIIDEKGHFYHEIRHEINLAQLHDQEELPYGVYDEDTFDEALLRTLENDITPQAGLAYFDLVAPSPIASDAPDEALLTMAKGHFGEKAFYGKRRHGLSVFVPYLGSQEEMMGKVRKVVQLFSYSEEENHINAKAGIAFYPELSPRNLTSNALKATVVASPLATSSTETEVPLVGYKAANTVSILLSGKIFTKKLQQIKTRLEASLAFKEFVDAALPCLGAEMADILTYDIPGHGFRVEEEGLRGEGAGFSRFAKEGLIDEDVLLPLYDWAKNESTIVLASNTAYLPEAIKAKLDNLELKSVAAFAVSMFGKEIGLIVLGSLEYDLTLSFAVQRFFAYVERYLHILVSLKERDLNQGRVGAMLASFEHYAYGIQGGSYNLSYISPNLANAIPEAKLGMPCYKALFGFKKPCKDCPLFTVGIEKVMPMLSSGVFAFRALPGDGETLMVLSPHESDFSSSRLDALTGFLSDASLHEDLQNEILIKFNQGQVLAFRIRNADPLRASFRLSDTSDVVRVAAEALISARLSHGIYRNGDNGFAYLLPFASKKDAIDLAERVSKVLTAKLPFHGKQIELYLDFALVDYPVEANDVFSLDSLLRVLYSKADASSRGRIFEVSHPEGRMIDHNYFIKLKIEEGLRAGAVPVLYRDYEELSGNRLCFQRAYSAILDEDGVVINDADVQALSIAMGKSIDSRVAVVRTIVKYLAKVTSKTLKGIILPVTSDCFSHEFFTKVDELFVRDHLERKRLIFEVNERDIHHAEFSNFALEAKKLGYRVALSGYKGDLSKDELKGYIYVAFDASNVYGAHKDAFLVSLASVRELGLNILVDGYASKQEKHYLASLSFHYGMEKDAPYRDAKEILG